MNYEYSLEVYKDHAIVRGFLNSKVLTLLIRLCKQEGFTHMQSFEGGFKLVRKVRK